MAKQMILIRHGKAEDHGVRPDFDRKLTEKGIRELQEMAPVLAQWLEGKESVVISSPLVRARETADIIVKALHCPLEEETWVADGVFSQLEATKNRPEDVVLVIGHNPTFDDWHYALTGEQAHFKKGAVAVYAWERDDSPATLIWMRTARELAQGGPPNEA